MSLLNEDFDIHLGTVGDNVSTLYVRMVRMPEYEFLRIFNQSKYENQKHKKNVRLDDYVVRVRVHDRVISALTEMHMDELDGPTLTKMFLKLGFDIHAIIMYPAPQYQCDPRISERTKLSFILCRRNNRNTLKEVMRIEIVDHFANESLWNAVKRIWYRYPKNWGQVNDKDLFASPIYQIKRQQLMDPA